MLLYKTERRALPEETLTRLEAVRAERAGVATLSIVAA